MYCSARLRAYHDRRLKLTEVVLLAALNRMQTGKRENIGCADWTKIAWAREAGLNVNTVVSKRKDGAFVFEAANRLFDEIKQKQFSMNSNKTLRVQNATLMELVARMQQQDEPTEHISL